ncbi:hypothetical protein [Chryseobacterium turcicum]|uniref:Uncharacterized protein n=1 Tax=Chryseobacterium turcicum TaxID=2898076 RepID=A0A9Q3V5Y0_9FLAO|nr:hypothetical protein [Chryseobacterium turcicum]MCD1118388.1 hypothetical protein [Chryseobacterium turcicum]
MEIKISLNEYADVAFIKKLLSQIKDIKSIEFFNEIEEPKEYSWDEIESSEEFHALIKKSQKDFEEGRFVEHSPELIESIFRKK